MYARRRPVLRRIRSRQPDRRPAAARAPMAGSPSSPHRPAQLDGHPYPPPQPTPPQPLSRYRARDATTGRRCGVPELDINKAAGQPQCAWPALHVGARPVDSRETWRVEAPETRYVKTPDGAHIAYQVFGKGPFDLVYVPGFASNVEYMWRVE